MKKFAVLEQGNKPNTKLAKKRKRQFTTSYSDCFRLNWADNRRDKQADFYAKNITWSEGRSLLYEKTKGQYEYYIFIDDDVDFCSKTKRSVSEEISDFLSAYTPLSGTIFGDNWCWDKALRKKIAADKKKVFCVKGHDLYCHIFASHFADLMFPVIYHGSEGSMWYAQYVATELFADKCLVLNTVNIKNTQSVAHRDSQNIQYNPLNLILNKFNHLCHNSTFKNDFNHAKIILDNYKFYDIKPNPKPVKATIVDIGKIFNTQHPDYLNRKSTAPMINNSKLDKTQQQLIRALKEELEPHDFIVPQGSTLPMIFYDRKYRFIYFQRGKTACSSVLSVLYDLYGIDIDTPKNYDFDPNYVHDNSNLAKFNATSLTLGWDFIKDETLAAEILFAPNWYRFSIKFNPYQRIFSAWKDKIFLGSYISYRMYIFEKLAKPNFVEFEDFINYLHNGGKKDQHWMQIYHPIYSSLDNMKWYDIKDFNHWIDDFNQYLTQYKVNKTLTLPHVNASIPIGKASAFYTQDIANKVYDYCVDDFKYFGYARNSWYDKQPQQPVKRAEDCMDWCATHISKQNRYLYYYKNYITTLNRWQTFWASSYKRKILVIARNIAQKLHIYKFLKQLIRSLKKIFY